MNLSPSILPLPVGRVCQLCESRMLLLHRAISFASRLWHVPLRRVLLGLFQCQTSSVTFFSNASSCNFSSTRLLHYGLDSFSRDRLLWYETASKAGHLAGFPGTLVEGFHSGPLLVSYFLVNSLPAHLRRPISTKF